MSDTCKTYAIDGFIVQENGIVRREHDGYLIGRLDELAKFSELEAQLANHETFTKPQLNEALDALIVLKAQLATLTQERDDYRTLFRTNARVIKKGICNSYRWKAKCDTLTQDLAQANATAEMWRDMVCNSSMCPQEKDPNHTCAYCKGEWAQAKAKERS